jgi:hypothetical protein
MTEYTTSVPPAVVLLAPRLANRWALAALSDAPGEARRHEEHEQYQRCDPVHLCLL